jgi:hypothetical protein
MTNAAPNQCLKQQQVYLPGLPYFTNPIIGEKNFSTQWHQKRDDSEDAPRQ